MEKILLVEDEARIRNKAGGFFLLSANALPSARQASSAASSGTSQQVTLSHMRFSPARMYRGGSLCACPARPHHAVTAPSQRGSVPAV